MNPILNSVQEYIESGEYFSDARRWYIFKYVTPFHQKSLLILACTMFLILLMIIFASIDILLPLTQKIGYLVKSEKEKNINTINTKNSPLGSAYASIANIMVQNYIKQRENYAYDVLTEQAKFVQNSSTKVVFMQFENFMNIDNPLSPVLRYQKLFKRTVYITSIKNIDDNNVIVIFEAITKNNGQVILENMIWEATVSFIMDKIDLSLPQDAPFNFIVTNYKLKLLNDKNKK